MTDAQSFYLLLAAFYLYECLSFAPGGAQAFVSQGARSSQWRWREFAFRFSGTNKDIFCAPIIPWRRMLVVFPPVPTSPQSQDLLSDHTVRHLRKRAEVLDRLTRPLKNLSFILFVHYFCLLPFFYYFLHGSIWVIIAILAGEALAIVTACKFYFLHRRIYPEKKGERRLETFFNAFFPWHAMRASDLFIENAGQNWHPLGCLVSHAHAAPNLRELRHRWRKATLLGDTRQLTHLLVQANIDPTSWNDAPNHEPGQQYCPLCHTIYEAGPDQCADCHGISLQTSAASLTLKGR